MSRSPPTSTLFPYTTLFRSEWLARRQADDHQLAQGAPHTLDRDLAGLTPGDQLREQRIVEQRHVIPCLEADRLGRSEEHTSELQSHHDLVCRLLLAKKIADL